MADETDDIRCPKCGIVSLGCCAPDCPEDRMDWKALAESLMASLGEISDALGIPEEEQATATGAEEIVDRITEMMAATKPVGLASLHPDHIRAERRACMFGDVIENHTYAMQAAVIERYAGAGAESAMTWIVNTLAGPGHMPDLDAAVALPAAKEVGPAHAWFDMKSAEHEAFRVAHPMPAAPAKGTSNG